MNDNTPNWKYLARDYGMHRWKNETLFEWKTRVLKVYEARQRAERIGPWRKDNPDGFSRK